MFKSNKIKNSYYYVNQSIIPNCFLNRIGSIAILYAYISSNLIFSQNLIPNNGFENHQNCTNPFVNSTVELCDSWFNAFPSNNTVDWYSDCFCGPIDDYCPPNLYYGNTFPHTGQCMIGFDPFFFPTGHRETIGVKLIEPLIKDSAYCLSFWIKNSLNHGYLYSLDHLDILFLSDSSGLITPELYQPSVRFENEGELDPGNDWIELSAFFIANGNEEYMYIGEFGTDPSFYHSDPDAVASTAERIYYYFDDFQLFKCNKDSLIEPVLELPNVFTPNNDFINDIYELEIKNLEALQILVLNRWGEIVFEYDGLNTTWTGNNQNNEPLHEGVYYIKAIVTPKYSEPFVKYQFVHLIR